jgi:hypothetical protein
MDGLNGGEERKSAGPAGHGWRYLIPGLILAGSALLSLFLYLRYRILFLFIFLPLGALGFRFLGRSFRSRQGRGG